MEGHALQVDDRVNVFDAYRGRHIERCRCIVQDGAYPHRYQEVGNGLRCLGGNSDDGNLDGIATQIASQCLDAIDWQVVNGCADLGRVIVEESNDLKAALSQSVV